MVISWRECRPWTAYHATGMEAVMPHYLALLAAASEIAGQIQVATFLFDETLQIRDELNT